MKTKPVPYGDSIKWTITTTKKKHTHTHKHDWGSECEPKKKTVNREHHFFKSNILLGIVCILFYRILSWGSTLINVFDSFWKHVIRLNRICGFFLFDYSEHFSVDFELNAHHQNIQQRNTENFQIFINSHRLYVGHLLSRKKKGRYTLVLLTTNAFFRVFFCYH